MEKERDSLLCKLIDLDKKVSMEREQKEKIQMQLDSEIDQIDALKRESLDMETIHDGLREKVNVLKQVSIRIFLE